VLGGAGTAGTGGQTTVGGGGTAVAGGSLPQPPANPPRVDPIVPYDSAALPSGVRVPNVLGMSQSAALSALHAAGFAGSVRHGNTTTDVPVGAVYFMDPAAESYKPSGSTVVIWLSTGPPRGGFPYPRPPY
jgi:hypothetical protein